VQQPGDPAAADVRVFPFASRVITETSSPPL
jgi:hypothetical protein